MRLIDAEKLVEDLQKWDTPESNSLYNFAMDRIIRQPIVYDTGKVVEQLDVYITKLVGRNSALYQTVMQIVKGGGVDGD